MPKRIGLSCFTTLGLAVLASVLASMQPAAADPGSPFPDTIALPNGWRPEGIAIGHGTTIYSGSMVGGAVFAADLATGQGAILVPPQAGRSATGLSFDPRTDLLWVAGGPTGAAFVYDGRTGDTVATYQLSPVTPSFVNDQIVTSDAVYFTESLRPVLYRVPLSRNGRPAPGATVTEIPLGGDFVQAGGLNANGIVATPGDRDLIVVNSALGTLYRVDPATGNARLIDLGGATVPTGDGLLLRGNDLFVVQNRRNQIAVFDLDPRFETARLAQVITNPRFDVPTTIDSRFGVLYVVNARFNTPPTADTTYTIEKLGRDGN